MKKILAKISLLAVLIAPMAMTTPAMAATVSVGNSGTVRSTTDTYSNFTIIDTNNPVSVAGTLNTFSYYASNTNPFEFVLVDSGNVVKWISSTITPASIGTQTFTTNVAVQAGWNLGAHFDLTGTVPFDFVGAPATYTPNGNGMPVVGSTLTVEGTNGRTYSWGATGSTSALSNGGFEIGNCSGSFATLNSPNSTDIAGWTVDSGSIDYICGYWPAADGSRSIDLNGNEAGSVSQTLTTIPGSTYTVTFALSGNPDGSPSAKIVRVSATGGIPAYQDFIYTTGSNSLLDMQWANNTFTFVASSTSTTLTFASQIAGAYGPALDNVSITETSPAPKPMDQCKNNGWKTFPGKTFKNQGDCVSYIQSNDHAVANKNK